MKNCLNCKLKEVSDCDFGEAVNGLLEYRRSEDGLGTVVELLIENIEQYIDCDCYQSK